METICWKTTVSCGVMRSELAGSNHAVDLCDLEVNSWLPVLGLRFLFIVRNKDIFTENGIIILTPIVRFTNSKT